MTQALYRKWRPNLWDDVAGQEHIVTTLRNAVAGNRVAHAYLFAGPRGTGKTTCARLLAKAVNCLDENPRQKPCNQCDHCLAVNQNRFMDLIEIDAASNTSVDDVRDLREKINFSPSQGQYKVYIIDEVHMLSTAAFNALLKTLEEPPSHAIFILATTEIHKIPATVLSRCQKHEFRRLPQDVIIRRLKDLCREENLEFQEEALSLIARQSTGSLRDAISLLDQLSSLDRKISLAQAHEVLGTATNQLVIDLVDAILDDKTAIGLTQIHKSLDAGTDARQFARQIVEYLRGILMIHLGSAQPLEVTREALAAMKIQARRFQTGHLVQMINAFNEATLATQAAWHPGLGLELAFTKSLHMQPDETAHMLIEAAQPTAKPTTTVKPTPAKPPAQETAIAHNPQPEPVKVAPATAQTPATEKPETAQTAQPAESSLKDIHQKWNDVRQAVGRHNKRTEALLNSSRLMGIRDGSVLLSFASDLLKEKMEKPENVGLLRQALKEIFSADLGVACIVGNIKNNKANAHLDVDSDGMVGTATRDWGAEITEITEE